MKNRWADASRRADHSRPVARNLRPTDHLLQPPSGPSATDCHPVPPLKGPLGKVLERNPLDLAVVPMDSPC